MRLLQDYEFDFVGGGCGSNPTCYCVGQDFAVDIGTNPCAVDGATNAVIERTSSSSSSGGIVATIGGVIKRIFGGKVSAGVETETTTTTTTTIEVDCSTTDSGSGSGGDGDGDGDDD